MQYISEAEEHVTIWGGGGENKIVKLGLWIVLGIPHTADCTTVVILLGNRWWPYGLGMNRQFT